MSRKGTFLLKPIAVILSVVAILSGAVADARITRNTIDGTAKLTDNGRTIIVTGPIQCDQTQPTYMRVTVSQRSTGAVANGIANITCTADEQQWEVRITTQGNATFEEGPAFAVALAKTTQNGKPDDAHQWLVPITLVKE